MLKNIVTALLSAIAVGGFWTSVLAAPVDELSIGGTSLSLSTSSLHFFSPGGAGIFDVGSSSTGAYSALGGSTATIQDLSVVTGAVSVPNFLTIPSLPNAQFTLTSINPGLSSPGLCGAAPAPGQSCTLPGSPFTFTNTTGGVVATFSASGTVRNTATGAQSSFTATFTTEVAGKPYQVVLAELSGGNSIQAPYSASIRVPSGDFAGTLALGQPSLSLSSSNIVFAPTKVGPSSSGGFAALNGSTATIANLGVGAGASSVLNFLTIAGHPELHFDLSSIDPGIYSSALCGAAPAPGQTCTLVTLSALNFLNGVAGSVLSFSVRGTATDTATLQQTAFGAIFSTEFDVPYQVLLAGLLSNGQVINTSYSVEFTAGPFGLVTSVPTPGTLGLVLASLWLLLGLSLIRPRQAS